MTCELQGICIWLKTFRELCLAPAAGFDAPGFNRALDELQTTVQTLSQPAAARDGAPASSVKSLAA